MKIDLEDVGLNEHLIQEATFYENLYIARVSVQYKNIYKVLTQDGEINAEISGRLGYNSNGNSDYPAVGDWVMVDRLSDLNGNSIIHNILRRKSVLERRAAGTKSDIQIIAANIDIIFICMSLNNDYNIRRMERYLSIAWDSAATPVIVLTKTDLCEDIESKVNEVELSAPGVDIITTSVIESNSLDNINKYISKGKTIAFIGSSGVGKSTLINRLAGEDMLATGSMRNNEKGSHTTTHRQLIVLPNGGVLIDTPGMREIQVANADLTKSFNDIDVLAQKCRFRDCKHETEPGCEVIKAIEDGTLSVERLENYKKLERELKYSGLSSRQLEHEKINHMFGSMGEMKQAKDFIKEKNKK